MYVIPAERKRVRQTERGKVTCHKVTCPSELTCAGLASEHVLFGGFFFWCGGGGGADEGVG